MSANATKIKRFTVDEKFALADKAKTIPYPVSVEEAEKLLDLIEQAEERGDNEEADRLHKRFPMDWSIALAYIEQFGAETVRNMGFDMSYAVQVLGESFVYGE